MFNLAATPRLRERAARISIFTQSHIWWKNLPEKRQFLWFTARCASFLKDIQINNNTQSQQFLKYWKYLATVTFSFVLLDTSFYIKWLFFSWFEFMDTKIPTYVILAWAWFLSHCSYFYSFYFCGIWQAGIKTTWYGSGSVIIIITTQGHLTTQINKNNIKDI